MRPSRRSSGAHPVDILVGRRLRSRRKLLGLTQRDVAAATGLTFQQIQKYETAASRISASRLHELAKLLRVPICYFFEGSQACTTRPDGETKREILQLMRAYHGIGDRVLREKLLELVQQIGLTASGG